MIPPFSILRPESVAEACDMLAAHDGDAAVYAGGTELVLAMKLGLAEYPFLVDLKGLPELSSVTVDGDVLRIGSTVTHRRLERSPELRTALPSMRAMEREIANPRVRGLGTIGGNLAFGEPHSDPAVYLVGLGASVLCRSVGGASRVIPAGEFLAGPFETVLESDEVLVEVQIPLPARGTAVTHQRVVLTERPAAIVTVVLRADAGVVSEARIAVGAATATPARFAAAEGLLLGAELHLGDRLLDSVAQAVTDTASIDPDADVDHVRHLVGVLVRRGLRTAAADLRRAA
jgi:carbon-monoxide dehydrogenase medium subunit